MNKNEIKKALYKQNPKANLEYIRQGIMYYATHVLIDISETTEEEFLSSKGKTVKVLFEIPINDTGTADFFPYMDAKHLIRWIVNEE